MKIENVKTINVGNLEEFVAFCYSPEVYTAAKARGESFEQILKERMDETKARYIYEILKKHGRLLRVPEWFVKKEPFWPTGLENLYIIREVTKETEKAILAELVPVPPVPDSDEVLVQTFDGMMDGAISTIKSFFTSKTIHGWFPKSIIKLINKK